MVINAAPGLLAMKIYSYYKPSKNEPEKYLPFVCADFHKWAYWKIFLMFFSFWPRLIVGWINFWTGLILVNLVSLNHVRGTEYKDWQRNVLKWYAPVCSRMSTYCAGYIPWK